MGGGDQSPNRLIPPDIVNSLSNNKKIILRNPNFNRPWQHVLDPLYGYLILAANIYKNPKNIQVPGILAQKKNTVTSVLTIVKYAIKNWGHGKLFIKNKKNIMSKQIYNLILRKQKNS